MGDEHEHVYVEADSKTITMVCGTCQKRGTASFLETDDPEALAEERLHALACVQ